ncbi:MAG: hypothetical protein L0Y79_08935 [Chlorobi bacterium]|nr:hypothetical protein [Chlorobiota bacterium]MCI0714701.1 hypothetical protein [Chlorobiota bacterium]
MVKLILALLILNCWILSQESDDILINLEFDSTETEIDEIIIKIKNKSKDTLLVITEPLVFVDYQKTPFSIAMGPISFFYNNFYIHNLIVDGVIPFLYKKVPKMLILNPSSGAKLVLNLNDSISLLLSRSIKDFECNLTYIFKNSLDSVINNYHPDLKDEYSRACIKKKAVTIHQMYTVNSVPKDYQEIPKSEEDRKINKLLWNESLWGKANKDLR